MKKYRYDSNIYFYKKKKFYPAPPEPRGGRGGGGGGYGTQASCFELGLNTDFSILLRLYNESTFKKQHEENAGKSAETEVLQRLKLPTIFTSNDGWGKVEKASRSYLNVLFFPHLSSSPSVQVGSTDLLCEKSKAVSSNAPQLSERIQRKGCNAMCKNITMRGMRGKRPRIYWKG